MNTAPAKWTAAHKIAAVMQSTKCTEQTAREYLIAEEGDIEDAVVSLNADNRHAAAAALTAEMTTRLHELQALRDSLAPAELARWVVLSGHGLPLRFTIVGDRVTDPRTTNVENATRFNRATARAVAAATQDGTGAMGTACTLGDAIDRARAEVGDVIEMIARNRPTPRTA